MMLSHTPPTLSASIGRAPPQMKRLRAGSISGRLRSLSEAHEGGFISLEEKGKLKELIIAKDAQTEEAIRRLDEGDHNLLKEVIKTAADPLDIDLYDFNFDGINLGGSGSLGSSRNSLPFSVDGIGVHDESPSWHADLLKEESPSLSPSSPIKPIPVKLRSMKEDEVLYSHQEMFEIDMEERREDDHSNISSMHPRLHKDSISGIEEFVDSSPQLRSNHMLAVFHDDFKGTSLFGGNEYSSSNPIGIPRKDSGASFLGYMSPSSLSVEQSNMQINSNSSSQRSRQKGRYDFDKPRPRGGMSTTKKKFGNVKEEPGMFESNQNVQKTPFRAPADLRDNSASTNGKIGAYSPNTRRQHIERYIKKIPNRVWEKRVKYDVRKNFADSRLRVKGRFVKKEDEELLRELLLMTL